MKIALGGDALGGADEAAAPAAPAAAAGSGEAKAAAEAVEAEVVPGDGSDPWGKKQ